MKIVLSASTAFSSATPLLSRPTKRGTSIWGKTTMSRKGNKGKDLVIDTPEQTQGASELPPIWESAPTYQERARRGGAASRGLLSRLLIAITIAMKAEIHSRPSN